jgi:hypothetical protein
MAPNAVYLHIGLHKTGTTYLQNMMRANREALRAQGVEFPGGPGEPAQDFAVLDLQGRRRRGVSDPRVSGQWRSLVEHVNASPLPTALVSEERLSLCTLKQARRAATAFQGSRVHVIVTARDLGRVAVSAWQEDIKGDTTWTWREYVDAIKDPARVATNPARGFWMRQDLVRICQTWETVVPAHRLHVVTVPQPGSPPEKLLRRFSSVVGFDADLLVEEPRWSNETVGVAATEVIRRVNERLGGRLNRAEHDKVMKMTVVRMLARHTEPVRFTLPAEELPWITERAQQMIAALQDSGYPVVGSLDELLPRVQKDGRRPDNATDAELLEASLDALAMLAEEYARTWWKRRRSSLEGVEESKDVASRARRLIFQVQRRGADLADRNPVAARALAVVLAARDRARLRARARRR